MEDLSASGTAIPADEQCLVTNPDSGQPAVRYVHMGPAGRDGSFPYDATECINECGMARAVNGGRYAGRCALGNTVPAHE